MKHQCNKECTVIVDESWDSLVSRRVADIQAKSLHPLTFLDIGANVGVISLSVANMHNINKIFSVEMVPDTFNRLLDNSRNSEKIQLINVAVSNTCGTVDIFPGNGTIETYNIIGNNFQHERNCGSFLKVRSITLDKLKEKLNQQLDIIKIDVEGAEVNVIEGGIKTIAESTATIVEIHNTNTFAAVCKICQQQNWQLFCCKHLHPINTELPSIDFCYQVIILPNL